MKKRYYLWYSTIQPLYKTPQFKILVKPDVPTDLDPELNFGTGY